MKKLVMLNCCEWHRGSMYLIDENEKVIKVIKVNNFSTPIYIGFRLGASSKYEYTPIKNIQTLLQDLALTR